jgi:TrmH family RNA methyltransferase
VITSLDNPRVREVLRLRRSRERRKQRLFVAEGAREVERALAAGLEVVATYFAPELIAWPHGGEEVSERVLRKMTYRVEPEGVVAVVEAPERELPREGSLYLVAVGIEKPGNLGAMARSADAAGADALVVADAAADPWNPNAIRASTGAVFTLPAELVAAVVGARTSYTDADLARPVAIAVGPEDIGLADRWTAAASVHVAIPVKGATADSLNASAAAAVLLFEAVRQRARGHRSP